MSCEAGAPLDLIVVGSGPAGMSALLTATRRGLETIALESAGDAGGQLLRIYSCVTGVDGEFDHGASLADAFTTRLGPAASRLKLGRAAAELLAPPSMPPAVRLDDGSTLAARAVVIASGLRPRTLDVPGENHFAGRGVSSSATRDRAVFAGRPVMVVGGGDAAFENALLLAEVGCRVTLVVRGEPRAREEFRRRVDARPEITVMPRTRIERILGESWVNLVRVVGPEGQSVLEAHGVFVKIGSEPNTEWCRSTLACDADGYLRVDANGATSAPNVWAAGDVTGPKAFTIQNATESAERAVAAIAAALAR